MSFTLQEAACFPPTTPLLASGGGKQSVTQNVNIIRVNPTILCSHAHHTEQDFLCGTTQSSTSFAESNAICDCWNQDGSQEDACAHLANIRPPGYVLYPDVHRISLFMSCVVFRNVDPRVQNGNPFLSLQVEPINKRLRSTSNLRSTRQADWETSVEQSI